MINKRCLYSFYFRRLEAELKLPGKQKLGSLELRSIDRLKFERTSETEILAQCADNNLLRRMVLFAKVSPNR